MEGLAEAEAAAIIPLPVLDWARAEDREAITLTRPMLSWRGKRHSEQWEVSQAHQAQQTIIKARPLLEMFTETIFSFRLWVGQVAVALVVAAVAAVVVLYSSQQMAALP